MAVIGWILFIIFILLLSLVLVILFVPFGYEFRGVKDAEAFSFRVKAKWLFGLIRVFFDFPEPKKPVVKIAFFTLSGGGKKKKKGKKKEKAKVESEPELAAAESPVEDEEKAEVESTSPVSEGITEEAAKAEDPCEEKESGAETEIKEKSDSNDKSKKKKKASKKEKKKLDLGSLKEEAAFYKELWEDENTKPFLKDAIARVFHVLKNLLPRKIKGRLIFGAASPDVTGYAYGAYCVISTVWRKRFFLTLEPDFNEKRLEGEIFVKGHFMIFTLVLDGLRLVFDKRLKQIRKKLKARKEQKEKQAETEKEGSKETVSDTEEKKLENK